jgi:hypothetical protein
MQFRKSMKRACVAIVDAAHARFFRYTRDARRHLAVDRTRPGAQLRVR